MLGKLLNVFKKDSGQKAKSRLHFVLVQDRSGLTGEQMAEFKEEIMSIVEKYFTIDKTGFDVSYKREDNSTTLLINSPVVANRVKPKKINTGSSVGSKEVANAV